MGEKETGFQSVSHATEDVNNYKKLAAEVSKDLGIRVTVPQVIRMAVTFYSQRRKLVDPKPRAMDGKPVDTGGADVL